MIDLYSGTPGSGKSLHTAFNIYHRMKQGRPIICNFQIDLMKFKNKQNFTYCDNSDLTPDYLINYSREYYKNKRPKENEILLVIDECQIMFNAREWNIKGRAEWLYFFTHHRKFGYKIILVAQFDKMIDRQIRSLIEYEYVHRKVSNFGIKGWLLSFWSFGKLFISVKVWYPMKQKVGSEFFLARKKYYQIYDTFNTFDSKTVISEVNDRSCNEESITSVPDQQKKKGYWKFREIKQNEMVS